MNDSVPFTSTCPSCAVEQPQRGFPRAALRVLLRDGQPIEAYCAMCDRYWPINVRERVELARAVPDSDAMYEPVPFTSICPECFAQQPQRRYSGSALRNLFKGDHAIKAYCANCDAFWDISPQERAALTRALAG